MGNRYHLPKGVSLPVARDFRSSDQARDHAVRDGEKIIAEAAGHFGVEGSHAADFMALPRGDLHRVAVT